MLYFSRAADHTVNHGRICPVWKLLLLGSRGFWSLSQRSSGKRQDTPWTDAPKGVQVKAEPSDVNKGDAVRLTCSCRRAIQKYHNTPTDDAPEGTSIQGPSDIKLGSALHLSCFSNANPEADHYSWYYKSEDMLEYVVLSHMTRVFQILNCIQS
ncbi:hypothetical protein AOLI_G00296400 [Acnodon oligacanthus]